MSRLFYPVLFTLTAALAATLWVRHGLPTHWIAALGAAVAQAQSPSPADRGPAPAYGAVNGRASRPQRLPPTGQQPANPSATGATRARQAPYTQAHIEPLGGPGSLEITRPMQIPGAQIVARVGNDIVLAADVLPLVNEEFEHEAKHLPKNAPEEYREQLFLSLMIRYVKQAAQFKCFLKAAKDGLPEDKLPEMQKQILSHFKEHALPPLLKRYKVKNEVELEAKLKEQGSSIKAQQDSFIDQIMVSEWLKKEIKFDEHVSVDEMWKYYNEHLSDYQFKAKARYEEIRINYGKNRSKPEAWSIIRGLAERVYAGASMAQLAKEHSQGVKAADGGLHDWTSEGSLACKPLDAALFTLPIGALSNIIDDDKGDGKAGGFIIVRVIERTDAGTTSFREAQSGIRDKIKTQREQEARTKKYAEVQDKYKLRAWTIYDDLLRQVEQQNSQKKRR